MKDYLSNYSDLIKEWHPFKNGDLIPDKLTFGSGKKVWWQCSKNPKHEWVTSIVSRTKDKTNCPYCSGNKASEDNNLLVLFPQIAKEWHPSKNKDLKPENHTHGSNKKIYWSCTKGHTYLAAIKERTRKNNTGCPFCAPQTSKPEIRILSECMSIFKEVISRYKIENYEIDVFVKDINVGIEFDGSFYHKEKEKLDLKKNQFLKHKKINLLRIRQHPLKKISDDDLIIKNQVLTKSDLNTIIWSLKKFTKKTYHSILKNYCSKDGFVNEQTFKKYLSFFPSPLPENSLSSTHPKIAQEWDYRKNFPLNPQNFTYGSSHKVFWICKKGHSYITLIKNRTGSKKAGCPYCSGKKVGADNNLKFIYPEIAKEWHPTKNGKLKPEDFTHRSGANVFWLCSKGHEYKSTIARRSRTDRKNFPGCPHCKRIKMKKE